MSDDNNQKSEPSLVETLAKLFLVLFVVLPITLKLLGVAFRGRYGKVLLWTLVLTFMYHFLKMYIKSSHWFGT